MSSGSLGIKAYSDDGPANPVVDGIPGGSSSTGILSLLLEDWLGVGNSNG
jgi:hypothetical protein